MKIFLDTAHVPSIEKWVVTGLIDGVTTNPSHLSKEGGDPTTIIKKICSLLPEGEVSIEVTESEPEKVYQQAKQIAALAENVVVKIPCHQDYYPVIKRLVSEDVPLNITLVFSVLQGLMMCKLGVHYISPFVGRLDDSGVDGIAVLNDLCAMVNEYAFETEILAASLRTLEHMQAAVAAGADVVTVKPELLAQAVAHPLTDAGMKLFAQDWAKLGVRHFP